MALLLSAMHTLVRPRAAANSKAWRMMRCTPLQVLISSWIATSSVGAGLEAAADADVDALGVLAEHDEVDVGAAAALQRAEPVVEQLHRPVVDVEIELEAGAEQDVAGVAVVGHARVAERADEHRVELVAQHR